MRVIKLKNNPNIRDIGGRYKNITLRENMLLRGRTFLFLTLDQIDLLTKKHHLRTIIDLRSHDEIHTNPEQVIPGTCYEIMPIFEREKGGISHKAKEKVDEFQIYRTLPEMDKIYFDMLHGVSLDNIGKIIDRIVSAKDYDYAFYFHCSEGKDRTGLVAAILLLILGVNRKEIVKDYMLTNKMAARKAFKYYMHIKYLRHDPKFARKVGRTFLAKKQYINVLFDVIDNEYGTLEKFLSDGLHINMNNIEGFKAKLIKK